MLDNCYLLKLKRHFSPADKYFSKQGVLGGHSLKKLSRKKSLQSKRGKGSSEEVQIINPDHRRVALLCKEDGQERQIYDAQQNNEKKRKNVI